MTPSDAEARVRAAWPGARIEYFAPSGQWIGPLFLVSGDPTGDRCFSGPTRQAAWEAAAAGLAETSPREKVLSAHPAAFVRRTSDGWHVFASAVRLLASGPSEAGAWGEAARGLSVPACEAAGDGDGEMGVGD